MSTPIAEATLPLQDRMERLSDRVLAVGRSIAAQGKGNTFTMDAIYDAMPDISRQRLSDAVKTLKDARRIHAIGRAKGIYELEEAFPQSGRSRSRLSPMDGSCLRSGIRSRSLLPLPRLQRLEAISQGTPYGTR